MCEPRGHGSMSGAILQPPTRPDADWGVLFIEVSGLLPMCGHGTMGVATVLVETGMVPVVEPVTTIRLEVPAGLVVAEGRRDRRPRHLGDAGDGARRSAWGSTASSRCPGTATSAYDIAYGGNFYAVVAARVARAAVRARGEEPAARRRPGDHGRDRRAGPAGAPAAGRHQRLPPRLPRRARLDRAALAARDGDLPRLVRPLALRHRHLRADGPAARPRRAGASATEFVNESFIGSRFTGRLLGETTVGDLPAVLPSITGRAWVTGMGQYLLDPDRPVPGRLHAVTHLHRPLGPVSGKRWLPTVRRSVRWRDVSVFF